MNAEDFPPEPAPSIVRSVLSSLAVRIYVAGIALIFFTVLTTDALNPRGRRGASWFDDLLLPLGCISFLVCVSASFFAPRPVAQRFGFAVLAAAGFAAAVVAAFFLSMMIFGLPDQD